jgi:hypothetical protein
MIGVCAYVAYERGNLNMQARQAAGTIYTAVDSEPAINEHAYVCSNAISQ